VFCKKTNKLRGWRVILLFILLVSLVSGSLVLGFYSNKLKINPMYSLMFKVERKLGKLFGEQSLTEKLVKSIKTTFVELQGRVFEIPNNDYANGGALTEWGEDLVVMTYSGNIYFLDEITGLMKTKIVPPNNGLQDYMQIAKSEKYSKFLHKFDKFRFNDIQYINTNTVHGISISYTFFDLTHECYTNRVSWLAIDRDIKSIQEVVASPLDWDIIFDSMPCIKLNPNWTALDGMMAGGRVAFSAPNTLFLGSGDYHLDGIHTLDVGIQSNDTSYGKVIAIDILTRESKIVSKGHRNLQGLTFDKKGRLWATEHGVRGGDELNLIKQDSNYGWPLESLGTLYSGQPIPNQKYYGRHQLNMPPVFAWLPSAGISSLTSISGIDESWDGDLLAGSLSSAEFGQSLFHIRVRDERVVFVERIKLNKRIRYVTQYGHKKIAVWLDGNELVIFDVLRYRDPLVKLKETLGVKYGAVQTKRILGVLRSCNECHSFDQFNHKGAPSLNAVVGRKIAATSFANYSSSLQSLSGSWSKKKLHLFLKNPDKFAPGTMMPKTGLDNDELLNLVVDALSNINTVDQKSLSYN